MQEGVARALPGGERRQKAEEDTRGDGRPDKWETYENGAIKTVAFDERGVGYPTRRLTYAGGNLVLIETDPDGKGGFRT